MESKINKKLNAFLRSLTNTKINNNFNREKEEIKSKVINKCKRNPTI